MDELTPRMYCFSISRRIVFAFFVTVFSLASPIVWAQSSHLAASGTDLPNEPLPADQDQQPSTPPPPTADQQKTDREQAAADLKKEEKQRILGIVPNFAMMDNAKAPPLSPKQKFRLMFKSTTDPYAFFVAGFVAGIGQAKDSHHEYGQGAEGYFKRFGAAYADSFDGALWGNAILPVVLHEDPRYFRRGTGSAGSRILHAALSTVWCRRDDGTWGPNYANVGGNIIGGAISNIYYPEADRGASLAFTNALTVTAEGAIGAQLVEFWPDVVRHYRNKKLQKANAQNAPKDTAPQQ